MTVMEQALIKAGIQKPVVDTTGSLTQEEWQTTKELAAELGVKL